MVHLKVSLTNSNLQKYYLEDLSAMVREPHTKIHLLNKTEFINIAGIRTKLLNVFLHKKLLN